MNPRITISDCTQNQLDHVWANLREADRAEMLVSGRTDENYREFLTVCTDLKCGSLDGEPVVVWGHTVDPNLINCGFFATDAAGPWWVTITRVAKQYIADLRERHPDLPIYVGCDAHHTHSLRWLAVLGFEWTGGWINYPNGRLICLEYRPR